MTDLCTECGEPVDEYGCRHDDRRLCAHCLHYCRECRAAIADDFAAELAMDERRGL